VRLRRKHKITDEEHMQTLHVLNLPSHVLDDCPHCEAEKRAREWEAARVLAEKREALDRNNCRYNPATGMYELHERFRVIDELGREYTVMRYTRDIHPRDMRREVIRLRDQRLELMGVKLERV
jgi:hypothetical protein